MIFSAILSFLTWQLRFVKRERFSKYARRRRIVCWTQKWRKYQNMRGYVKRLFLTWAEKILNKSSKSWEENWLFILSTLISLKMAERSEDKSAKLSVINHNSFITLECFRHGSKLQVVAEWYFLCNLVYWSSLQLKIPTEN